jgi:hypothetical protein
MNQTYQKFYGRHHDLVDRYHIFFICILICLYCLRLIYQVEFKFKMGWTYNSGPGCNENRIGEFVNESFIGDKDWKCVNGCDQPIVKVGPAYYYCTAASKSEQTYKTCQHQQSVYLSDIKAPP